MSDVIEFRLPPDSGEPSLSSAPGRDNRTMERAYCSHATKLLINSDTQLVECSACHLVMSSYSALMVITKEWARMHYDTTEWRKMKAEEAKSNKTVTVRNFIRKLQWIETPEEDEPEARRYWLQLTEAMGHEPYAMFRRSKRKRTIQYCVLDGHGGWMDADSILRRSAKPTLVRAEA